MVVNDLLKARYPWCIKEEYTGKYETIREYWLFPGLREAKRYLKQKYKELKKEYPEEVSYNADDLKVYALRDTDWYTYEIFETTKVDFNIRTYEHLQYANA